MERKKKRNGETEEMRGTGMERKRNGDEKKWRER